MKRVLLIVILLGICIFAGCSGKEKETDLKFIGTELKDTNNFYYHNGAYQYYPDVMQLSDYQLVDALCDIYNTKQSNLLVESLQDVKLSDVYEEDDDNKYYFVLDFPEVQNVRSHTCDKIIINLNTSDIYLGLQEQAVAKIYWEHSMKDQLKDVEKHYGKIIAIMDLIKK